MYAGPKAGTHKSLACAAFSLLNGAAILGFPLVRIVRGGQVRTAQSQRPLRSNSQDGCCGAARTEPGLTNDVASAEEGIGRSTMDAARAESAILERIGHTLATIDEDLTYGPMPERIGAVLQ